ncbi:MAG: 2-oxoglutarate dehydrogenase E2 component (dihydrolipoamide succinyltransferase) [Arenicella sp.]|jgi:2-oxoglutarate dehydrogenase E2 component (dihydrolipoamide succinyltransferase)
MALVEMVMPKMGESVMEGTVLKWLKEVGEEIEQEESVLEVATDKVDTEVPAPYAGVLKEILAQEGDVIEVGKPIAIISTEAEEGNVAEPTTSSPVAESVTEIVREVEFSNNGASVDFANSKRFYSPLVKNIAKQENIPVAELDTVTGSGKDGRVTKSDILGYVEARKSNGNTNSVAPPVTTRPAQPANTKTAPAVKASPAVSVSGGDEIIEMDRMRKMIAQRMVDSKRISPHVTSFVEADLTNVVRWRNANKQEFKERGYGNLTFTPIFIEAIAKAIKDYPMINVSVDASGGSIIKKRDINVGMAVALPSGNLIVPVIRNADQLNLTGITMKVNDLVKRARANQLKPDELSGGTYTMSNVGTFGNVLGTPIIMQPQVAIMAFGAVKKKPAVIETPEGDMIAVRHMMFLSHSYDHRVVDGSLGGMFVRRVADYLEKFDVNQKV